MLLKIDEEIADVANIAEDVHGFFERLVLVGEGNG